MSYFIRTLFFLSISSSGLYYTNNITKSKFTFDLDYNILPKSIRQDSYFTEHYLYIKKLKEFTKIKFEEKFFQLTNEDFKKMTYKERIKFYRSLKHYLKLVKSNNNLLTSLIVDLEERLLLNKSFNNNYNIKITNDLTNLLIEEGLYITDVIENINNDSNTNKNNLNIYSCFYVESMQNLIKSYSQLVAYYQKIKLNKSNEINKHNANINLSKDQLNNFSKISEKVVKYLGSNNIIYFECKKLVENCNKYNKTILIDNVSETISNNSIVNNIDLPSENICDDNMILNINKYKDKSLNTDKQTVNIVFINGLNSTISKSWRVKKDNEFLFCKTKPSLISIYFRNIFNFICNKNLNTDLIIKEPYCLSKKNSKLNIQTNSNSLICNNLTDIKYEKEYNSKYIKLKEHIIDKYKYIKVLLYNNSETNDMNKKYQKLFDFIFATYNYKELWINEVLEKDLILNNKLNCNLYLGQIDSKLFAKDLGGIPDLTIEQMAHRLKLSIERKNILNNNNTKTIFVVHSMGGLILKEMIAQGLNTSNVNGVIFFSTPHFGSSVFASIANISKSSLSKYLSICDNDISEIAVDKEEIVNNMLQLGITNATNNICNNSRSYFENLNNLFINKNIPYCNIIETEKSYIYQIKKFIWIVKPESAMLSEKGLNNIAFNNIKNQKNINYFIKNRMHYDVCKMTNCIDEPYILFKDILNDYINTSKI